VPPLSTPSTPGPTRSELAVGRESALVHGSATKADVWIARVADGRRVVVKDFANKRFLVRWWGRLQNRREARFLALLDDVEGVPKLVGHPDPDAIVIEYLDGTELYLYEGHPDGARFYEGLERIAEAARRRGVFHNDLRGRENVLVVDGFTRIAVVDWAAALRLDPDSRLVAPLRALLRVVDRSALIKWKIMLDPDEVTDDDRAFLRRFWAWRRLWPFNRSKLRTLEDRG
jgi:RIO-like serine/threonine protein kinase